MEETTEMQQAVQQIKEVGEKTKAQNAANRAEEAIQQSDVQQPAAGRMNLLTNQEFGSDVTDDQIRMANEDFNRLGEAFGYEGASYTPEDVVTYLTRDGGIERLRNFNKVYGGVSDRYADYYNPELMSNVFKAYNANQTRQREAEEAAAKAKAAETTHLDYGEGRKYEMTAQNAEDIKSLLGLYYGSDNEQVRQQVMGELVGKIGQTNFALNIDPANPPKTMDELINTVVSGENGMQRYIDLNNILKEAERDRTPKMPEQKSIMDLYAEREARRLEIERDREAQRIERERLGRGIADISATIGDMIKATEGAPVLPRDWRRYYASLTAQQQANLNNYNVRMAKLRKDMQAQRMADAKLKADAAKAAGDKAFKAEEAEKEREWKAEENKKKRDSWEKQKAADRALRKKLAEDGQKEKEKAAKRRLLDPNKYVPYLIDGVNYYVPKGQNSAIAQTISGMVYANQDRLALVDDITGLNQSEIEPLVRKFLLNETKLDDKPNLRSAIKTYLQDVSNKALQDELDAINFPTSYNANAGGSVEDGGNGDDDDTPHRIEAK